MKLTASFSLLLILTLIFTACQKEQSLENGQSISSSGTLKSTSGECLPSHVNGLFKKGVAVTDSNYIDVTINVTLPGSYVVSSDTVNGIHFKGVGVFMAAGANTVRLKASGAPVAGGTFPFVISYNATICTLDVLITDSSTPVAAFTFTTTAGSCMGAVLSGTYTAGVATNASNSISLTVTATTTGTWSLSTTATNGITFSGSGTLAGTGSQVIVLAASGTPISAGAVNIAAVKGASNCTFSVTTQPGGTSTVAVFTLGGAGAACTGATLSGTYTANVAMTSANTAKIDVSVTTPGTYTISTTATNGVTFSGTGSFSASGNQQVTLTATGTPTSGGSYNFSVTAGAATCTFPVTFLAAPAPAAFTLSGAPSSCLTPVINGNYVATVPVSASNNVLIKVNVTSAGTYSITTNTVNGLSFSAAGVFTSTGNGIDVTLVAAGTPTAAGTSTFSPMAGSATCTFDVVTTAAPAGIYNCKIDGVFTSFYDRAVGSNDDSGVPYLYLDGFIAPPNGENIPEFQIFINKNDNSAVGVGTYNVDGYLLPNGYRIEIDYKVTNPDFSVTIWNTSSTFLTTNPPFTITITSVTPTHVKGTFSGKLTNVAEGSTSQKTITEGVFDLPIQ